MARLYHRDVKVNQCGLLCTGEPAWLYSEPEYAGTDPDDLVDLFLEQSRSNGYEIEEVDGWDDIWPRINGWVYGKLYRITRSPFDDEPSYFMLDIDHRDLD